MKVLSIDGGGVFGIIPSYFLSAVDISMFDVYCGTSVGSILALGYASGISSEYMHEAFKQCVQYIFSKKNMFFRRGPQFKDDILNKVLQNLLKGQLKDLNKKIVIPAFDIVNNKPKIFDNFSNQDCEDLIWEVSRKSCSAPSFFSSWNGFIDGGIVANSPSMVAIGAIVSKLSVQHSEIEMFSIGTGIKYSFLSSKEVNKWHRWRWIVPMLKMLTNSNETVADFSLNLMPLKKYCRFNPVKLEKNWNFTDPDCVDECIEKSKIYMRDFLLSYETFLR